MKYFLLLLNFLIITVSLFCQNELIKPNSEEDPMLYFPYQKGDISQFYEVDFNQILDTVHWEVKIDSLDTEGNRHIGMAEFHR
jgi:hypothetical protein